jgi:pimeloyl-ACP methyl ester carboxylesterase
MLHGFTLSSEQWEEYFDDFGSDYTIVAFDLPGHGKSDRPEGAFSYERWAELILQALESLGIDSAFGMGHSAGAITLLYMADKQPQLLQALTLVAGAPVMSTAGRDILLHDSFNKADAALQAYYLGIHFGDTVKIDDIFSDIRFMATQVPTFGMHPPIMERLKQLALPVYMVWGDRDPYFPMEIATELYKSFPNARLWVIPFQGHTPVWQSFGADAVTAEQFATSVRKFFSASIAVLD